MSSTRCRILFYFDNFDFVLDIEMASDQPAVTARTRLPVIVMLVLCTALSVVFYLRVPFGQIQEIPLGKKTRLKLSQLLFAFWDLYNLCQCLDPI